MANRGDNSGIVKTGSETSEGIREEIREEDVQLTDEQVKSQIRAHEEDFIQGLLDAASYAENDAEQKTIEIARKVKGSDEPKVFFKFTIHALSEGDYSAARKKHTKYVRNKQFGMKLPDDTDTTRYRSQLIYMATNEEDRDKLWNNKTVWEGLRNKGFPVANALDVIECTLKAGEKDKILEIIDEISGYDSNIEEVAKN